MNENGIGRKALDQNPLDEKRLDENWAHDVDNSKYRFVIIPILLTLVIVYGMLIILILYATLILFYCI